MNNTNLLWLLLPFAFQCTIDRSIPVLTEREWIQLEAYKSLQESSKLQIADDTETGQRLLLCLTFVSAQNDAPLRNQAVLLYHTTDSGEYEPRDPEDESTARLSGEVVTNEDGKVFIQTILPGDYGSASDNRHIHTTVKATDPEAYDIHFSQYISAMGRRFVKGSDQHFLADLKKASDNTLITFLTIKVKNTI